MTPGCLRREYVGSFVADWHMATTAANERLLFDLDDLYFFVYLSFFRIPLGIAFFIHHTLLLVIARIHFVTTGINLLGPLVGVRRECKWCDTERKQENGRRENSSQFGSHNPIAS